MWINSVPSCSSNLLPNPNIHINHRHRRRRLIATPPPAIRMMTAPPTPADALTSLGRFLWGRSLPPSLLISTVRSAWSSTWHLMMRQLAPSSSSGSYSRPNSSFPAVADRYFAATPANLNFHLYAAFPCPWAHRTLIVRALLDLESLIQVSIAEPGQTGPWEFNPNRTETGPDRAHGRRTLKEVYELRKGGYDGRATVPMLWDVNERDVVCNESIEIIKFFNEIAQRSGSQVDLYPDGLRSEIEEWNRFVYPNVNNGVYRCGFAQSQEAYDSAVEELFSALDRIESHLATSRYLCRDVLTIADVCLFTTLIRFDLVYNGLFKCTKKKLVEFPNLHGYTREIYQIPKVAKTCNFEAIIDGYYGTLFPLNPGGIRPVVPSLSTHESLSQLHDRELLSLETVS